MVLSQLVDRSLGMISTIVLARLLVPADFGLVSMASAVVALLELLSAFNFDMVLIQNHSAERTHYDTAWTFNVAFGAAAAVLLVLLAYPVAAFYKEPRLFAVLGVLGLGTLAGGFENIGVVAFRKELTFDREFRFMFIKRISRFFVTIILAITLKSYWALAAGIVLSRVLGVIFSYVVHPYRPRLCLAAKGELISFSKWLLLNNLISFFYLRSADFIVGRIAGAGPLGLYNIGFETSSIPTTQLIAPINRAVFPGYAKVASDRAALRVAFLKVISIVAIATIPAAFGMAAVAPTFVSVVLGPKWLGVIPLIQLLAIYGALTSLETNTYYVHLALGNVRIFTVLMCANVCLLIPLVIALTFAYGVVGAAMGYNIVVLLFFPLYYRAVMRKLDLGYRELAAVFWRPTVSAAIMYGIVVYAQHAAVTTGPISQIWYLMGYVLLGIVFYAVTVLALWQLAGRPQGAEALVLANARGIFSHRLGRE